MSAWERDLMARLAAESRDRASRNVYMGCPVCRQEVLYNCEHDGVDYSSVELPIPEPVDFPLVWEGDYE